MGATCGKRLATMLHATCCDMLRVENRTSAHTRAQHCCTSLAKRLQLFRERLSYKRGRAHATMSKVIKGNGGSYNCLIETQGVSAWWKETAQTRVFVLSPSLLLNHLKPQSCKALRLLPIITMGIVAHPLTLLWENLCRNSCICTCYARYLNPTRYSWTINQDRSPYKIQYWLTRN